MGSFCSQIKSFLPQLQNMTNSLFFFWVDIYLISLLKLFAFPWGNCILCLYYDKMNNLLIVFLFTNLVLKSDQNFTL